MEHLKITIILIWKRYQKILIQRERNKNGEGFTNEAAITEANTPDSPGAAESEGASEGAREDTEPALPQEGPWGCSVFPIPELKLEEETASPRDPPWRRTDPAGQGESTLLRIN